MALVATEHFGQQPVFRFDYCQIVHLLRQEPKALIAIARENDRTGPWVKALEFLERIGIIHVNMEHQCRLDV
jgi:hypothetical protein